MFPLPFKTEDPKFRKYIEGLGSKEFKDIKHAHYDATVDHALEMAVHAVKDPDMDNPKAQALIRNQRPNEIQEVFDYRVANYRQITLAAWEKILNTLYNIYNPRLTAIHYPEMDPGITSTLENYLTEEEIDQWFKEVAFETDLRDANAVVAVLIREESLGENGLPEPRPMIFESQQVIDYKRGEFYLLEAFTEAGAHDNMTGRVFVVIDAEKYVYYVEVRVNNELQYIPEDPVFHGCEVPPVVHMPGKKYRVGPARYNLSYLSGVLPNWNEALVVNSDYQAVRVRHAHPKSWQFKLKCPKCGGRGTIFSKSYAGGESKTCGSCNGEGIVKNQGPADILLIDPKLYQDGGVPSVPGGYIEGNVSVIEYYRDEPQREINLGLSAANMDHLSKDTNIQESGEAKKVGRTDLNTFMQQVADGIYKMQDSVIWFIAKIRYGNGAIGNKKIEEILPTIERPKSFDVKTPEEHAQAVRMGKEAGLSHSIIAKSELDYVRKEHGEDADVYKFLVCKLDLDPLPGIDPAESIQIEADTRKEDRWLHFNIDRLIGQAVDEHPNFYNLDRSRKLDILYNYVDNEIGETPGLIPSPGGDELEGAPADIQEEARARLRGTVGGVQGLLSVQESVANGITQYDAGIAILMDIYGFDDATARKLLGKPIDIRETKETVPTAE